MPKSISPSTKPEPAPPRFREAKDRPPRRRQAEDDSCEVVPADGQAVVLWWYLAGRRASLCPLCRYTVGVANDEGEDASVDETEIVSEFISPE